MSEQNKLTVDYNKIDDKVKATVRAIESKPHVRYIRYLLSKRYSPIVIKQELFRLGLSAPHEPNLIAYYMAIIDPIVRKIGLSSLYADYKNKLLRKNSRGDFAKDILNYNIHLGDNLDGQVKFNKFVKEIEVDSLWINEIFRFHGAAEKLPVDENGERILDATSPKKSIEKILIHPKRYLIDKMILENLNDSRISTYCRETLKMQVYEYDIQFYKKTFFNIKTHSIEDKIKALEVEKNSLNTLLKDLEKSDEMDIGERMLVRRQAEQRISELDDNIKTLNMMFSEFAHRVAVAEQNDFEHMFSDVLVRAYGRFCNLDNYKDRDVVDALMKVTRIMTNAHDKVESIKAAGGQNGISDKSSQGVLMELYKKRIDEINQEQFDRANRELEEAGIEPISESIAPENIAGIEELGVSFEIKSEEDQD